MTAQIIQQDIDRIIDHNPELINQLANRSFLVTGATGMIGRYVVSLLAEVFKRNNTNADNVILANARNREKAEQIFADYLGMENFKLVISDVAEIKEPEQDIDYIIHAASPTQPQDFLDKPADIIRANVVATNSLLEISRKKEAKFCLLSTLEVYGEIKAESYPAYVTEDSYGALDSLSLRSAYPESKRLAENLCVAYQKQFNVDSTIIRLAPTISPIIESNDSRVFAQFVHSVTKNKDITIFSDAAPKERSYTYIADAVSGIMVALMESTRDNFVFNLANNDNVISIKGLAEKIIDIGNQNLSKLTIVDRENDTNTSSATGLVLLDSNKLINLGWKPIYSLDESVRNIIQSQQEL